MIQDKRVSEGMERLKTIVKTLFINKYQGATLIRLDGSRQEYLGIKTSKGNIRLGYIDLARICRRLGLKIDSIKVIYVKDINSYIGEIKTSYMKEEIRAIGNSRVYALIKCLAEVYWNGINIEQELEEI